MRRFRRAEVMFGCAADQHVMSVAQAPLATAGPHRGPARRQNVAAQALALLRQRRVGFDSVVLVAGRIRRISTLRAAVVRSCDCRADSGGAHAYADTTAHVGPAIGGPSAVGSATVGAAGPNTACVNTTGANAACMDSSGTADSNREGIGRHARDPKDRCRQAG